MPEYRVRWEIDLAAATPRAAAAHALSIQRTKGSLALVFDVFAEGQKPVRVDLDKPDTAQLVRPANLAAAVEALRGPSERRQKAMPGECVSCDRERAAGNTFHPPHDASDGCESGKHPHCSCDTCF